VNKTIDDYQKLIKEFETYFPKCKVTAFNPGLQIQFEDQTITIPSYFIEYLIKTTKYWRLKSNG